jgi:hypothetical protein
MYAEDYSIELPTEKRALSSCESLCGLTSAGSPWLCVCLCACLWVKAVLQIVLVCTPVLDFLVDTSDQKQQLLWVGGRVEEVVANFGMGRLE